MTQNIKSPKELVKRKKKRKTLKHHNCPHRIGVIDYFSLCLFCIDNYYNQKGQDLSWRQNNEKENEYLITCLYKFSK